MSLRDEIAAAAAGAKHQGSVLQGSGPDKSSYIQAPIQEIQEDLRQPREDYGDLLEMAESIKSVGVLQPLIVHPLPAGGYGLVMGHRRLAAAKLAGLAKVPCIVRSLDDHRRLEVQIIENIHRKAFTPVEEAAAYERLMTEYNYDQEAVAKAVGRSRSAIAQTLRILSLPEDMLDEARETPHASSALLLEVAKAPDESTQRRMFAAVKDGRATVRALRSIKDTAAKLAEADSPARPAKPPGEVVVLNQTLGWPNGNGDRIIGFSHREGDVVVYYPEEGGGEAVEKVKALLKRALDDLEAGRYWRGKKAGLSLRDILEMDEGGPIGED